jgi:hypothetical protein
MTETRPDPDPNIELRHLAAQERTCAALVKAAANQILIDSAHGRMVPGSGRKLATQVVALCEAQAVLARALKTAARTRAAA